MISRVEEGDQEKREGKVLENEIEQIMLGTSDNESYYHVWSQCTNQKKAKKRKKERKKERDLVQWFMPVIPVAQEAEAGGLQVQSRPQQLSKSLSNLASPCLKF